MSSAKFLPACSGRYVLTTQKFNQSTEFIGHDAISQHMNPVILLPIIHSCTFSDNEALKLGTGLIVYYLNDVYLIL